MTDKSGEAVLKKDLMVGAAEWYQDGISEAENRVKMVAESAGIFGADVSENTSSSDKSNRCGLLPGVFCSQHTHDIAARAAGIFGTDCRTEAGRERLFSRMFPPERVKTLIDSTEDFNFAKGDIPRHEIVTSMQAAFFAKGRTRNKPLSAFLGCAATVEMAERMAAEDRQNLTFPGIFYVATEDKPRMLGEMLVAEREKTDEQKKLLLRRLFPDKIRDNIIAKRRADFTRRVSDQTLQYIRNARQDSLTLIPRFMADDEIPGYLQFGMADVDDAQIKNRRMLIEHPSAALAIAALDVEGLTMPGAMLKSMDITSEEMKNAAADHAQTLPEKIKRAPDFCQVNALTSALWPTPVINRLAEHVTRVEGPLNARKKKWKNVIVVESSEPAQVTERNNPAVVPENGHHSSQASTDAADKSGVLAALRDGFRAMQNDMNNVVSDATITGRPAMPVRGAVDENGAMLARLIDISEDNRSQINYLITEKRMDAQKLLHVEKLALFERTRNQQLEKTLRQIQEKEEQKENELNRINVVGARRSLPGNYEPTQTARASHDILSEGGEQQPDETNSPGNPVVCTVLVHGKYIQIPEEKQAIWSQLEMAIGKIPVSPLSTNSNDREAAWWHAQGLLPLYEQRNHVWQYSEKPGRGLSTSAEIRPVEEQSTCKTPYCWGCAYVEKIGGCGLLLYVAGLMKEKDLWFTQKEQEEIEGKLPRYTWRDAFPMHEILRMKNSNVQARQRSRSRRRQARYLGLTDINEKISHLKESAKNAVSAIAFLDCVSKGCRCIIGCENVQHTSVISRIRKCESDSVGANFTTLGDKRVCNLCLRTKVFRGCHLLQMAKNLLGIDNGAAEAGIIEQRKLIMTRATVVRLPWMQRIASVFGECNLYKNGKHCRKCEEAEEGNCSEIVQFLGYLVNPKKVETHRERQGIDKAELPKWQRWGKTCRILHCRICSGMPGVPLCKIDKFMTERLAPEASGLVSPQNLARIKQHADTWAYEDYELLRREEKWLWKQKEVPGVDFCPEVDDFLPYWGEELGPADLIAEEESPCEEQRKFFERSRQEKALEDELARTIVDLERREKLENEDALFGVEMDDENSVIVKKSDEERFKEIVDEQIKHTEKRGPKTKLDERRNGAFPFPDRGGSSSSSSGCSSYGGTQSFGNR